MEDNLLETDRKRYADDVTVQELVRLRVENERLREKYEKLLGASVVFHLAIHNALFVFEKAVDDIHQKDSE